MTKGSISLLNRRHPLIGRSLISNQNSSPNVLPPFIDGSRLSNIVAIWSVCFSKGPRFTNIQGHQNISHGVITTAHHLDSGGNFIEAKTFLAATSNISVSNIEFCTQRRNALFPAGNDHFIKKMRSKELEQFHQTNPSHHPALSRPLSTPVKLDKLQAYLDGYPARSKQYVIFVQPCFFSP